MLVPYPRHTSAKDAMTAERKLAAAASAAWPFAACTTPQRNTQSAAAPPSPSPTARRKPM
eukprot:scaffold544_cov117-Isochrysis_galbana.AAC.35